MRSTQLVALLATPVVLALVAGCAGNVEDGGRVALTDSEQSPLDYQEFVDSSRDNLLGQFPGADVPPVAFERYISPHEWAETMVSCLRSEGFTATERSDGGIDYGAPPEGQAEALAIADFVCAVRYPVDRGADNVSDAQLSELYDYYVEELVPCLDGEGYNVAEIPSATSFKEGYFTSPWSPYTGVEVADQSEWDYLTQKCPQLPESLGGAPPQ